MKKQPLLTPTLRWFLLAMILANVASEMFFTLLAVYLAERGAGVAQIGLTFSIAAIVPLALQIFGGWLSDTIGRLRTIAIGSVAASLGYVLMPIATKGQWAIPALMLEYVSGSLVGPSFMAFVAEQAADENRGRVFGIINGIFLSVTVIGPALGGFLAFRYGFQPMLTVAAVMYVGAAVLRVWMATAVRFGAGDKAERPTLRSLRMGVGGMFAMLTAGGLVTWLLVTDGVQDVAFTLSGDLQPLYLAQFGGLDAQQIGWLASVRGVGMIAATLLAGWLSDRHGERRVIAAGFLLQFLALMVFVQTREAIGFAVAAGILGLGFGTLIPAYDSLISKAIPEKMRGIAFGVFGTSIGLISLPAPWLAGQLWERSSPQMPFVVTALAALICVLPVWVKLRLPEKTSI
ncbi:MAG: MFS transporter [Chloroflexi bacterium]|nr:MFS transporter [Chloroflexota bacterium]